MLTEEATIDETKRMKRMRQVRALIDKANDRAVGAEERAVFLAKADQLMTAYVIEEWELEFAKPAGTREAPIMREFLVDQSGEYTYYTAKWMILDLLAGLCRCKIGGWNNPRKVFGYESDLDYLDLLYTSVMLHLSSHLDPKVERSLSWIENMAFLRYAGNKWEDVHRLLRAANLADYPYDEPWRRAIGVRFTKEFKIYSERQGRARVMAADTSRWVESLTDGYVQGLAVNVKEMRGEQESQGGLVLVGREEAVDEALYEMFPDKRPHPENCDCENCHFNKCFSSTCQRTRCKEARKPMKMGRARKYVDKTDYAALQAGRTLGKEVNLGRGAVTNRREEIR